MENLDLKQKVLGIVYILAFVTLFTGLFNVINNLAYAETDDMFYVFFITCNWVVLGFGVVASALIVYNFFAKKALNILEIIIHTGAIIAIIVLLVLGRETFISNYDTYASIYSSYLAMTMQLLAAFVLLLGAKVAMIWFKNKQVKAKSEVQNDEQK